MNPGQSRVVPDAARAVAASVLVLLLGGCFGPDLDAGADSLVAQEAQISPERLAAKADIRRRAEAAEKQPYPDPFQAGRSARLATRAEPRTVRDVASIQAELAAIALLQQTATTPEEIAELDARAAALRDAAVAEQAGRARR